MTPEFPLISVYKKCGLDVYKNDAVIKKTSIYTLLKQKPDESELYDRYGNKWIFSFVNNKIKNNFINRFLAITFYNPMVEMKIDWKQAGSYQVDELKEKIFKCIDEDDDIITQYEDGEYIKELLKPCDSFEKLIAVLDAYVFEVDVLKLWPEQKKRNLANS